MHQQSSESSTEFTVNPFLPLSSPTCEFDTIQNSIPKTLRISVQAYWGLEGLNQLKEVWQLDSSHPFYHRWEWYFSYVQNLAIHPNQNCFFVGYDQNLGHAVPVVILPFEWTQIRIGLFSFRIFQLILHPHLNLCDIVFPENLIPSKSRDEILRQVLQYLKTQHDWSWDYVYFPNIVENSVTYRAIASLTSELKLIHSSGKSAYFTPLESASQCTKAIPSALRQNVKRWSKKALELGESEFVFDRNPETIMKSFEEFLRVESSGWKGSSGTGTAISLCERTQNFYRKVLELFSKIGQCQINLLKVRSQTLAAQFCLFGGTTAFLLKIGYNQDFSEVSPGSLLLYKFLLTCAEDPNVNTVSLVTAPAWAKRWHPKEVSVYQSFVFRKNFKGIFAYFLIEGRHFFKNFFQRFQQKNK